MNRAKIVAVDRARACDPELAGSPLGIDDTRPRALRYFDKSPRCQILNRAAYGFAAHRESRRKLTLARQFIPHLENAGCNMRRKLVADLFLDGPLDDAALQVKGRKRRNLQRPSGHFLCSN